MTNATARLFGLSMVLASACTTDDRTLPPPGQLLLYVDTDAPLPAPPGETLGEEEPPALFDRVRIEVFRPGENIPCADCTHEFDLDRSIVANRRASVGITTVPHLAGHRARVRLFRRGATIAAEPRADATLDTIALLPPTEDEGSTPVTVVLRTDDLAKTIGSLDAPVPAEAGPPVGSLPWPAARRVPCEGLARPGEVCVPGGAAWMGHPLTRVYHDAGDVQVMRLVVLPPFFIDATEVTVERFRAANVASATDPMRYHITEGAATGGPPLHCTYTDYISNDETLPVTCISWAKARQYCQKHGGDLPTEAQHQYVASALEGRLFPWGEDAPQCDDAVYARSRYTVTPEQLCPGSWVTPPRSGARDEIVLPGGTVYDLAGNVAEWALDLWNLQTESCWGTGVHHDPVCGSASNDPIGKGQHTVVGGSYVDVAADLVGPRRRPGYSFASAVAAGPAGGANAAVVTSVGFRCARSAAAD